MADEQGQKTENKGTGLLGIIIRFIIAAIVLLITSYLVPGFDRMTFGTALVAAIVISLLDYAINRLFKFDSPCILTNS